MTMDRNGVNEYLDDDYSNSTCDCKFCREGKGELVKRGPATLEELLREHDLDFEIVWDDTQRPEPPEFDESIMQLNSFGDEDYDEDMEADLIEILEEDEIIEVISGDLEDAFINVLYSLQTGETRQELVEKIVYLEGLLEVLKFIPSK